MFYARLLIAASSTIEASFNSQWSRLHRASKRHAMGIETGWLLVISVQCLVGCLDEHQRKGRFTFFKSAIAIMFPICQIFQVVLMLVSLFLKPYIKICLVPVSVLAQQHEPLHNIPDEKRNIKQFPLLCGMYLFVVQFRCAQWSQRKNKSKQANGIIFLAHRKPLHQIYPVS